MQMVSLHRDPEGENVFSRSTPGSSHSPTATSNVREKGQKGQQLESYREIESLQGQVKELQLALSKYEPEVSGQFEKRPSLVTFNESQVQSSNNGVAKKENEMNSTAL